MSGFISNIIVMNWTMTDYDSNLNRLSMDITRINHRSYWLIVFLKILRF